MLLLGLHVVLEIGHGRARLPAGQGARVRVSLLVRLLRLLLLVLVSGDPLLMLMLIHLLLNGSVGIPLLLEPRVTSQSPVGVQRTLRVPKTLIVERRHELFFFRFSFFFLKRKKNIFFPNFKNKEKIWNPMFFGNGCTSFIKGEGFGRCFGPSFATWFGKGSCSS
jgi:hypothetical protein